MTTKRNINNVNELNFTNTGDNTSDNDTGKSFKNIIPKIKKKEMSEHFNTNPNISGENFISEQIGNEKINNNPHNPKM